MVEQARPADGAVLAPEVRQGLLALYDLPDPQRPGRVIHGYDKEHAERTARMVLRLARRLGIDEAILARLEGAALLHDVGRAGMDHHLFGLIFASAQEAGLPVRVRELVGHYPQVRKKEASRFFLDLVRPVLERKGLSIDDRVRDHVDMRMAFDWRLRRILRQRQPELARLGFAVEPWMEQVMLYYYYPEEMDGAPGWVRLMGEMLVACENLEAYNNHRRGRDYYSRQRERMREAFQVLAGFRDQGLISTRVYRALLEMAAAGELDDVIKESRGLPPNVPLPPEDRSFLVRLRAETTLTPSSRG